MNFLRKHWYDIGGILSLVLSICIFINYRHLTNYQLITRVSLITLLLHQLEEYRIAGTFPGMLNAVVYKSDRPDRYPLNSNTAFLVNVIIGWTLYAMAAVLAEKAIWLGMATTMVSLGNIIAHTILFNIKGKTFYNAGLFTSWVLFAPCTCIFFSVIHKENLVTVNDYLIGIPLGVLINFIGVLKSIDWMADKDTNYIFDDRNLLPSDRKQLK